MKDNPFFKISGSAGEGDHSLERRNRNLIESCSLVRIDSGIRMAKGVMWSIGCVNMQFMLIIFQRIER